MTTEIIFQVNNPSRNKDSAIGKYCSERLGLKNSNRNQEHAVSFQQDNQMWKVDQTLKILWYNF